MTKATSGRGPTAILGINLKDRKKGTHSGYNKNQAIKEWTRKLEDPGNRGFLYHGKLDSSV